MIAFPRVSRDFSRGFPQIYGREIIVAVMPSRTSLVTDRKVSNRGSSLFSRCEFVLHLDLTVHLDHQEGELVADG